MRRSASVVYEVIVVCLGVLLFALAGCSGGPTRTVLGPTVSAAALETHSPSAPAGSPAWNARPDDEIAPGFQISLEGAADSKVNGTFTVGPDGVLPLPYDVKVAAAGITAGELSDQINSEYRRFLVNPGIKVAVKMREYYVNVGGLVAKPGPYLVKGEDSLDALAAQAGGLLQGSDSGSAPRFVRIDQLGVSNVVNLREYFAGRRELVPRWQGGETVFFQNDSGAGASLPVVRVLGQVRQPGEYPVVPGGDFYEYLTRAGGPTDRADLANVTLVQEANGQREAITFASADAAKLPPIKGGDVLLVNAENASSMEKKTRIMGGIGGFFSAIANTVLMFVAF